MVMAERVGFEPTVPAKVQQFSRLPDSTTLAPLRKSSENVKKGKGEEICWLASLNIFHALTFNLFDLKKFCIRFRHSSAKIPDSISI